MHIVSPAARPRSLSDYDRERAEEHRLLRIEEMRAFIETAFRDGAIRTTGTAITKVLPPASRFSPDGGHGEKKRRVLAKLGEFFERFFGLGASQDMAG